MLAWFSAECAVTKKMGEKGLTMKLLPLYTLSNIQLIDLKTELFQTRL